ncbi:MULTISPECIES: hypothetical protein [unclassified Brevundimonas]|jgi:hypothetical protein|uniref:hypothetical protein n=1 Tax=unclassified Brevundimonas TaxID=2622653 RepID=UPI003B58A385
MNNNEDISTLPLYKANKKKPFSNEILEEKTDIQISVESASSGVSVDGSFHIIVVDNKEL